MLRWSVQYSTYNILKSRRDSKHLATVDCAAPRQPFNEKFFKETQYKLSMK